MIMSGYERTTQKQSVLSAIRDKIQFLELKPGVRINERAVAEEYAVSRTPVREALILLADEKLVDILPQSGTFVTKIQLSLVAELVYMRHIVETRVLEDLCARGVTISAEIGRCLVMQEFAVNTGDVMEFIRYDDEFHKHLFDLAEVPEIWRIVANSRTHHTRFRVLDMHLPQAIHASFREHVQLVDCLAGGKRLELQSLLRQHHDAELMNKNVIVKQFRDYFS